MDPVQAIRAAYEEIDNAIPEQDRQNGHQVQLIIVFVKGKRSCCYNNIKYYGDVELGVPIQVVSDSTLRLHTGEYHLFSYFNLKHLLVLSARPYLFLKLPYRVI